MSVTSTGADFSACAARRPPNPPPTMMTRHRLLIEFTPLLRCPMQLYFPTPAIPSVLHLCYRKRWISGSPLRCHDPLTKFFLGRLGSHTGPLRLQANRCRDVNPHLSQVG